ncbi:hypothetical protein GcM1_123003 [Golovinomyces cichoracearum]|uniref:Uncharacterized protein n=1 Tax=Golovinomyces cichoracearum TaxID=62708 RepID=A0A420JBV5_9PEZI|nr:hypothetical protein GcM1_123003 [Golovinomyces cichoracearum]
MAKTANILEVTAKLQDVGITANECGERKFLAFDTEKDEAVSSNDTLKRKPK